ncbi:hypothetical protein ILUMI_23970 [Ignelater luminosus]|uniref:Methylcytosine dioxygenase TET n=1 Tax=Ignelater luminosus TaxID=2038154 RepID=A0A8K0C7V6_IGNLU|nr:hypothetical protein ILUMI_23970 [Ignelater luminosus]
MAPMPFYADPNRFSTPVWQADPTQGWAQGQFIQQIPAVSQPPLEGYPQQYSNGIYQATYQQPPGFESNTFYTGAVQVLARPPSAPNQTQLATRPNGSYSHTPSPVSTQPQQTNQRNNISGQYQQEYASNNQNYVPPTTPTGGSVDSSQTGGISRPSSVNSAANVPTNNQNFQTQHAGSFTPISSSNFSPVSNAGSSFVNSNMTTSSGNAIPGYPPVNSHPQLVSHNYSGGYPGNELSGQNSTTENCHSKSSQQWSEDSDGNIWEQNGPPQQTCNKESAKSNSSEIQQYPHNRSSQNIQIKTEETRYNNQQNDNKQTDHQISQDQSKEITTEMQFSQADRINLNSKLKTMILNKQQQQLENKMESQKIEHNKTGHFLSYSHHRQPYNLGDGGGFPKYPLSRDAVPQTYVNEMNHKNVIKENNQRPFFNSDQNFRFLEGVHNKFNNFNSLDCESVKHKSFSQNQKLNDVLVSRAELTKQEDLHIKNEINVKSEYNNIYHMGNLKGINSNFIKDEKITQEISPQKLNNLTEIGKQNYWNEKDNQKPLFNGIKIKEEKTVQKRSPLLNCTPESDKFKNTVGVEIPPCECLPHQQVTPEPGSYYTHLGCANSLVSLRKDLEDRTGVNGKALRIEKILYTGKEGKTPQGCPIAKWILRRANYEEKYLIIVKQRPGHFCHSAVIVVCIVAWDGVLQGDADAIYGMLCEKLNKYGLPTNRRCATNEPRTCACQGLDPESCGASFSFGCSWSMYYNGCKYARSKTVRKFRLSVKTEEDEVEERLQNLATNLSPLYKLLAPQSFKNQCQYEHIASDCRLGLKPGRPFSGVTACMDFCAHAHKDFHNMNNGCTVVVTLTKHREFSKPEDEQLHVLPLYVMDNTDEFGSRRDQEEKIINGSIEVLERYHCEVRVRNIPQPTCRRNNVKKRKDSLQEKPKGLAAKKEYTTPPRAPSNCNSPQRTPIKQLQSNHVSSTVLHHSDYSPMGSISRRG